MKVPDVNSIIYVCSKYFSSKRCYFSKGCTRKGSNLKEFSRSYTSIDRQLSFFFFCFHFIITYSLICFFQEYLARLEAIRRQNFQERKEIQRRMAGVRAPVTPSAQVIYIILWGFLHFLFHGNWRVGLMRLKFFFLFLFFSPATDQMLFFVYNSLDYAETPSFSMSSTRAHIRLRDDSLLVIFFIQLVS